MSRRNNNSIDLILGCFLIVGINTAVVFILVFLGATVSFATCFSPTTSPPTQNNWVTQTLTIIQSVGFSLGLLQLLYVIPLALRFKQQQQWEWMKGTIIGAVLTALLNAVFFFQLPS